MKPKLIPPIDFEEIERKNQERRARLKELEPDGAFPATSLLAWLDIAEQAGIESIPAEQIGVLSFDELCSFIDAPTSYQTPALADLFSATKQAEDAGKMIRADCCAGYEVKSLMAAGRYPERPGWYMDDPRIFDLIRDDGRDEMPIVSRPWRDDFMVTQTDDGRTYPVEFRVFFGGDAEDGAVSAYYPQAEPLSLPIGTHFAEKARAAANRIIVECVSLDRIPWMPIYGDNPDLRMDRLNCTLDFAITQDGKYLFLEAGPAYFERWGAHPCCFQGATKVEGIALRPYKESEKNAD